MVSIVSDVAQMRLVLDAVWVRSERSFDQRRAIRGFGIIQAVTQYSLLLPVSQGAVYEYLVSPQTFRGPPGSQLLLP